MPEQKLPNNPTGAILRAARECSNLSLRAAARRAGTSHATLSAYEKGRKSPSTATFFRILDACDVAPDVSLHKRIRTANKLPRGEELAEVLRLAEQFPVRRRSAVQMPVFPFT
ncbi:MAG: helix-turn-helix transcriptional regulator [Pseudomonadales bacterium]